MTRRGAPTISKETTRRIGYGVAIGFNIGFLVIVNNVLDWGWFPWLTEDLTDLLPIINVSVIATIVANAVYLVYDPPWFKGIAEVVLLTISLIVTIRLLQVFPFDFSAYDFAWATLTRWALGVAIFGIGIAMLVQLVKLARLASDAVDGADRPTS
jgi:hypothetical protein